MKPYLRRYAGHRTSSILHIDSLHLDYLVRIEIPDTLGYDVTYVYTAYIGSSIPHTYFNLYLEEYASGTLSDPYVLMYRFDTPVSLAFQSNPTAIDSFVGAVSKHEMDVMFGSGTRDCCDLASIARCWEIVFGEPLDVVILDPTNPSNPGGPGQGGGTTGPRPPGTGTLPGGWDGNTSTDSGPGGGSGGSAPTGCWVASHESITIPGAWWFYWDEGCDGIPDPKDITFAPSGGEVLSSFGAGNYTECIRLLIACQFLSSPPTPDPNQLTFSEKLALDLGFEFATEEYDDIVECLDKSKAVSLLITQLLQPGALTQACEGNTSPKDMIHDALLAGCAGTGLTKDQFLETLSSLFDIIHKQSSFISDCPLYDCVFERMRTGDLHTPFICDLLSEFDSPDNFILIMDATHFSQSGLNPTAAAVTKLNKNSGGPFSILMRINSAHCGNNSILTIFETLQHELVHADIFRRLSEYYTLDFINTLEIQQALHQLTLEEFGPNATPEQHALMLEYYLDQMAQSLLDANNGVGTLQLFKDFILNGFPESVLQVCGYSITEVIIPI